MAAQKPKVLVSRKLPDAVEARLTRDYDAVLNSDDHTRSADEIAALGEGCDALLVSAVDRTRDDIIGVLPASVRIISTFSVGFDHIDVAAATARGITVTNTPDVLTDATAEIAMLCLLGAARRSWEAQAMLREDRWIGWRPTQLMGIGLTGRILGIVGMGRIGVAMAERARGFGLTIHYHDFRRAPAERENGAVFHETLETLLPIAHFVSLHCPATPDTERMINAQSIGRMMPGAVLVNTARGTLVDDEALIAALRSGRLAAAGLDVFVGEPAIHPDYRTLTNAYLLPHLGSATLDARNAMGMRALDNMDAFFAGRPVPDPVR